MSSFEIIERARCLYHTGNDEFYWKEGCSENGKVGTHPPFKERRDKLRKRMLDSFGEKSLDTSKLAEYLLKKIWEKTKPKLKERLEEP